MNNQLIRQLHNAGLDADSPPADVEVWKAFLALVDRDYMQAVKERMVLGRTYDASQRTERHIENMARESDRKVALERDKLKAVLASLKDGLCVFSIQGKLLMLNPAAKQYLGSGIEGDEGGILLGRFKVHDQWHPDKYLETDMLLELLREGTALHDDNARLEREDGGSLPISCVFNPIVTGQHVSGTVLLFQDIHERKKTEMDLVAAKEAAEKASSAKSEFMSSMSHELRTPMNAILGYADVLLDDLEDAPDLYDEDFVEEVRHSIQHIKQAGSTLLMLINEVLDLTRMENGKLEISIEKVNLVDIIAACAEDIMPAVTEAGLTLYNDGAGAEAVTALADASRLKQALRNLLSNAVKYNKEGGSISLDIERKNPRRVRILVKDTGIGIRGEQLAEIFTPFERMSGRNITVGTGIGLSVAKHLLEIMDGHIGVESQIEQGSTFWVDLPTGAVDLEQSEDDETEYKFLLLYIEDSRTNVSLVTKIVRVYPDVVLISAPTGEMGLELARAHHPDMVLLDINLPGIDGFEVLKRLQSFKDMRGVPILGLSADDTPEALKKAKTAGFYEYIIKPLKKDKFLRILNNLLQASKKS